MEGQLIVFIHALYVLASKITYIVLSWFMNMFNYTIFRTYRVELWCLNGTGVTICPVTGHCLHQLASYRERLIHTVKHRQREREWEREESWVLVVQVWLVLLVRVRCVKLFYIYIRTHAHTHKERHTQSLLTLIPFIVPTYLALICVFLLQIPYMPVK